jgi:hypothetical protein
VDYNPLKGMLVLISSLKLSIVPYVADPETQGQHLPIYTLTSIKIFYHLSLNN